MLGAYALSACVAMFSAQEAAGPTRGLFKTDGTVNGVVKLGEFPGTPSLITPRGSRPLFTAPTELEGRELYRTGGTPASTILVKDIWTGTGSSSPRRFASEPGDLIRYDTFAPLGGDMLFSAATATQGRELWRTNGTVATVVKQFKTGLGDGVVDILASTGSFAVVVAEHDTWDASLWATDGTAAGTKFLMRERGIHSSREILSTRLGPDRILFTQDKGNSLWVTDGTRLGTRRVRSFPSCATGAAFQHIKHLTGWPELNFALFSGCTTGYGHELWRTDGTAEGTYLVRNIMIGTGSSEPAYFYRYGGNRIYFAATSDQHGREIWRTDGTRETTRLVADIRSGTTSSNPRWFARFNNRIVFAAEINGFGFHWLHSTNGTSAGTFRIDDVMVDTPFANIGAKLVFGGGPGGSFGGNELMGTLETAGSSHLIQDIQPGFGGSRPTAITAVEIAQSGLPTPAACPQQ